MGNCKFSTSNPNLVLRINNESTIDGEIVAQQPMYLNINYLLQK